MKCPQCNSRKTIKNGSRTDKQCFRCHECGRQFVSKPKNQPYPPEVKELCLKMYLNGMGLRGIERVTEIHHTTIMNWIRDDELDSNITKAIAQIIEDDIFDWFTYCGLFI